MNTHALTLESAINKKLTTNLKQHQFDALASFAYNPGKRLSEVIENINQGKHDEAMKLIKKVVTSGGVIMRGLVGRREKEVKLYTEGNYAN